MTLRPGRLSRAQLPLSERDFQRQVTELAELYGWSWMHPRAGRTLDSWRTPTSGTLGEGWPDLVLIRGKRIIFAEIKADTGRVTPHQDRVLGVLSRAAEAYIWRPKDWDFIEAELRPEKGKAAA